MENNSRAGIYLLAYDDGYYVGQSNNVDKRLTKHLTQLREGIHPNKKLRATYALTGELPDTYILDLCPLDQLNNAEIYWMDEFDCYPSGYNQKPGGGFTRAGMADAPYIPPDIAPIFAPEPVIAHTYNAPTAQQLVWLVLGCLLGILIFCSFPLQSFMGITGTVIFAKLFL